MGKVAAAGNKTLSSCSLLSFFFSSLLLSFFLPLCFISSLRIQRDEGGKKGRHRNRLIVHRSRTSPKLQTAGHNRGAAGTERRGENVHFGHCWRFLRTQRVTTNINYQMRASSRNSALFTLNFIKERELIWEIAAFSTQRSTIFIFIHSNEEYSYSSFWIN